MYKQLAVILSLLAIPLFGESLSGEYGISGFDPYQLEPYQGKAILEERGDVYQIIWRIQTTGKVYTGTGIRRGDTLSVVFKNRDNAEEVGVQTYTIGDNSLNGKWIFLGRNKKGSETLKRVE